METNFFRNFLVKSQILGIVSKKKKGDSYMGKEENVAECWKKNLRMAGGGRPLPKHAVAEGVWL